MSLFYVALVMINYQYVNCNINLYTFSKLLVNVIVVGGAKVLF